MKGMMILSEVKMMDNKALYIIRSAIFGHAAADALGVPVEFCSRQELDGNPVKEMIGFGTYPYPKGTWSDDTSMSLCALDVLKDGALDWDKIMQNFKRWFDKGEYTPSGVCFDIGGGCMRAINNYSLFGIPALECGGREEDSNGNGSLMRILPFILFAELGGFEGDALEMIHNASALTHAHIRSKIGCGIYYFIVCELIKESSLDSVYRGLELARESYGGHPELEYYGRIFAAGFKELERDEIKSSGYVVDTLEAAVWCILNTDNYRDCVLTAVNLGGDTDTVAAVAGGMAGVLYGYDSIPAEWLELLIKREYIERMCVTASKNWSRT